MILKFFKRFIAIFQKATPQNKCANPYDYPSWVTYIQGTTMKKGDYITTFKGDTFIVLGAEQYPFKSELVFYPVIHNSNGDTTVCVLDIAEYLSV